MNTVKAKYSALDVAKWFIRRNRIEEAKEADKLSLLKLLKLLYYAEGCSLALNDRSLFSEDIIAWEHGPVVIEVYNKYKSDPFNLPFDDEEDDVSDSFSDEDNECLEQVFQVFGAYSAWALRNKTHKEEPWLEATNNGQSLNHAISRDTMKSYFFKTYVEES